MGATGRRVVYLGGLLLGLAALVGLASRTQTHGGSGGARSVSGDVLLQYLLLLGGVAFAVSVPVAVYALVTAARRGALPERSRSRWILTLFLMVATMGAFLYGVDALRSTLGSGAGQPAPEMPAGGTGALRPKNVEPVPFDWVPVIVVGGLTAAGAIAAGVLLYRGRVPRKRLAFPAGDALLEAVDESLDDLHDEGDPRRAVVAAYARMERALARSGLPRRPAEAAHEYLERALPELGAGADSVSRLTTLFERAKFSEHRIDTGMRDEAIAALAALRGELESR